MTNLQRRLLKLEQSELLMRHPSPLEHLQGALDDAAVRLTGKDFSFVEGGEPTMERIMSDLKDSFFPKLSPGASSGLRLGLGRRVQSRPWKRRSSRGSPLENGSPRSSCWNRESVIFGRSGSR
jgi:hypothetical protein